MSSDDNSGNVWQARMKAAVISVLSGDVYDNKAIKLPLRLFKLLYYLMSLRKFGESLKTYCYKFSQNKKEVSNITDSTP